MSDGLIAAVVLAAGMSARMGYNKLLTEIDGEPLVRRVVRAVEKSRARPIFVVSGHDCDRVRDALTDTDTVMVHNPDFRVGLSTSIRAGIRAAGPCDGAIILLGDMPGISSSLIDNLIAAHDPANGCAICVAVQNGQRGNPVLFDYRFFSELGVLTGDFGARKLVSRYADSVCEIEAGNDGPLIDIDTPADLEQFVSRS